MPLYIAQCTPTDLESIVSIYFAAFQNPLAITAFPDIPTVRSWWTRMLGEEMKDPQALFLKVVDQIEGEGDKTIAWAKWNKPKSIEQSEDALPDWPEGGDHELSNSFFSQMASKHEAIMKKTHWCRGSLNNGQIEIESLLTPHYRFRAYSYLATISRAWGWVFAHVTCS